MYSWPSVFYFTGCLGLLWSILWFYFCFDSPEKHPTISEREKNFILASTGSDKDKKSAKKEIPWKNIISSPAVLGDFQKKNATFIMPLF